MVWKSVVLNFVALFWLSDGWSWAFDGTPHPEWVGKPMPNINAVLSSNNLSVRDVNGPIIYSFVLPNCAPCALQLASLANLVEKTGLKVAVVSNQDRVTLQKSLNSYRFRALIIADIEGTFARDIQLRRVPAVLFVDATNTIRGYYEGTLSDGEFGKIGIALAQGRPVPKLFAPADAGTQAPPIANIDFRKSQSLLVFHQFRCIACKAQIKELLQFTARRPNLPVFIVTADDPKQVRAQFSNAPKNLTVIHVTGMRVFESYRIVGTPTQILVAMGGVIRWRNAGYRTGLFQTIP